MEQASLKPRDVDRLNGQEAPSSLEALAHDLARAHRAVRPPDRKRTSPEHRLDILEDVHRSVAAGLRTAGPESPLGGTAEWFLDNQHLILEALAQVREDLPTGFYRELPRLVDTRRRDEPRAFAVARAVVEEGEGHVDPARAEALLVAYQEITPLSMGELWAIPPMLRLALLEDLAVSGAGLVGVLFHDRRELEKIEWERPDLPVEERVPGGFESLRAIAATDWKRFFEAVSRVERALREGDPVAVHSRMDFETRDRYRKAVEAIARASGMPEEEVAHAAVRAAREDEGDAPRKGHVGYHLIGRGRTALETRLGVRPPVGLRLHRRLERGALGAYLSSLAAGTAVALAILTIPLVAMQASLAAIGTALLLGLIPGSAVAVAVVNWLLTRVLPPRILPKLDYREGIPESSRTSIVVPALLGSEDEVDELLRQLELNCQGNADDRVHFVLLTDFPDAPRRTMPTDAKLLERTRRGIEKLNRRHGGEDDASFFLLHRPRRWNPSEGCWMGWERKRGKLAQFNRLVLGQSDDGLEAVVGDPGAVVGSRYVITLDADTFLPRGTARRLVGVFDHPLNRPKIGDGGRLEAGYTVLQPRIETSPAAVRPTLFTRIFEADRGLDLYSRAVSDVYQDLFGTGIYVGKGIYDVAAFEACLRDRVPENALLSHDLFEGVHGRTALVTDVTLLEDFPDQTLAYLQRLHRWVRGDWQIARWVLTRVPSASGERVSNPVGLLGRWMILDNLRRSLLFSSLLVLAVGGSIVLPGPSWWWIAAALLALSVPVLLGSPVLFRLRATVSPGWAPVTRGNLFRATGLSRWLLAITLLPHRAYLESDAIVRTLWRSLVTGRHLLEWKTQAETARLIRTDSGLARYWLSMIPGPVVGIVAPALAAVLRPTALPVLAPLGLLWIASPGLAEWISRTPVRREPGLTEDDVRQFRMLARRTWRYYEDLVGPNDHWLPPDHFQEDPRGEPAHRTSPTNIGLMLAATLTAYDLGYLTPSELVARLENSFEEMEKLERHRGHFLNWYHTRDLSPLLPRYVSVVDSGNLAGCLVALKEGLAEISDELVPRIVEGAGLADTFQVVCEIVESAASGRTLEELGWADSVSRVLRELRGWSSKTTGSMVPERTLEERGLPILEEAIGRMAPAESSRVDPGTLARLRTWIVTLRQQIVEVRRDRAGLTPWIDLLSSEAPEWLEHDDGSDPAARAYQELAGRAPAVCRIGDVPKACRELARCVDDLELVLRERPTSSPGREAAENWTRGFRDALQRASSTAERIVGDASALRARSESWLEEMDFSFLFRPDQKLFHIGFNVTSGQFDRSSYDLLASEARLASLVAIAKGEIEADHWLHLGRPFGRPERSALLLSWAGTTFEYLMPFLLNRAPGGSLLELSAREAVRTHIRFGRRRGIPWGISESAYHELDVHGTYQYRAFGIPELAIRRDPADRIVVSPYASILALPFAPRDVARNARRLAELGMSGSYGLYEAMDFGPAVPGRAPVRGSGRIVRSFMAHHQGMILLAIGNALGGDRMVDRLHRDRRIAATEYLLFERAPGEVRLEPRAEPSMAGEERGAAPTSVDVWSPPDDPERPQIQVLSNGSLGVLLDQRGGSGMQWKGRAMTRWRPGGHGGGAGMWIYLQDPASGRLWSPTTDPTGVRLDEEDVTFGPHEVEWSGVHHGIASRLTVAVPSGIDLELRRLRLRNQDDAPRRVKVTTYGEPVLADPEQDRRHPALSKLFVEAFFREEAPALIFRRRKASPSQPGVVLGHAVAGAAVKNGEVGWETDRGRFLGRDGSHGAPTGLISEQPLEGREGATLDPIYSLSVTVKLDPGEETEVLLLTAAGRSEREVRSALESYRTPGKANVAFSRAKARARSRLHSLGMPGSQARQAQRILSALLRPGHPGRRNPPAPPDDVPRRQALWALGISGDHPILLVSVQNVEARDVILEAVRSHAWLKEAGMEFDLVVLDDSSEGYATPLLDWLRRALRRIARSEHIGRPGGVHYIPSSRPTLSQRASLVGAAALHLSGDVGGIDEQLGRLDAPTARLPPFVPVPGSPVTPKETPFLERPSELLFENDLGGFTPDGREYVIHLEPGRATPAPWINVIATPELGFTVSERGAGYTWSLNSGEHRLTPWTNDPVLDTPGEAIYLRDEETASVWSPTPGPAPAEADYQVRHGTGYTRFLHRSHGLDQELVLFASHGEAAKVMELRLTDLWSRPRRITATVFVEWVLGTDRAVDAPHVVITWEPDLGILLARNHFIRPSGPPVAFLASDRGTHGWTADRTEFLGEGGHADPQGLHRIGLGEVAGAGLDPCGALQVHIDLAPGETETIRFFLGAGDSRDEVEAAVTALRSPGSAKRRGREAEAFWDDLLGDVTVKTPDPALDLLVNRWAPYQALSSRIWGRTGLYQSSGAYGFRDQLQDVLAFLPTHPEIAREHILEAARHQFEEGDVLHWWHPPHGRGIRSRCSDDLLWLPWAVAGYVEATENLAILKERIPFLEGPRLSPGETERYGEYAAGPVEGSLYEHCVRALEKGMTSGPHGLPLIGSGDWNDGMDRVGRDGRGESVWLGWFIVDVATRFSSICDRTGDEERGRSLRARSESLRAKVEEFAWDGDRYVRATYDDGTPLGSSGGEDDRIDSISQSWAVLSGAGDPNRSSTAMDAVWRRLVDREDGLVLLLDPPFDRTHRWPGYIKAYPPGIRENGGQYTHAGTWVAWAFASLGDGDRAHDVFRILNPIGRARTEEELRTYRVEPYAVAADIAGVLPHRGRGGWTWYTGSAGWMVRLGREAILGLYPSPGGFCIDPCIPGEWEGYEVRIRRGAARWRIRVSNPDSVMRGVRQVEVDGVAQDTNFVPVEDDGKNHDVIVRLGAKAKTEAGIDGDAGTVGPSVADGSSSRK